MGSYSSSCLFNLEEHFRASFYLDRFVGEYCIFIMHISIYKVAN